METVITVEQVKEYIRQARQYGERFEYQESFNCYRAIYKMSKELVELYPDNADIYCALGEACLVWRKLEEATVYYQMALYLQPQSAEANYGMGDVHAYEEQNEQAIACYRKAVELNPQWAKAYFTLGNALWEKGDVQSQRQSLECLYKALNLQPQAAYIYRTLGNMYRDLKKWDKAMECYQKVMELLPEQAPDMYEEFANIYKETQQYSLATQYYLKITESEYRNKVNDGIFYRKISDMYYDLGQYNVALEWLQKEMELPNPRYFYKEMGDIYLYNLKQYDKAYECFQKNLERNPDNSYCYKAMGDCYLNGKQYEEALECFQKGLELLRKLYDDIRRTNLEQGSMLYDSSEKQRNAEEEEEIADYLYLIGYTYGNAGKNKEALEYLLQAVVLAPNNAEIHCTLGTVYTRQLECNKAIASFLKAIELNPQLAFAYYCLGMLYSHREEHDIAHRYYLKGAQLGNEEAQAVMVKKGLLY